MDSYCSILSRNEASGKAGAVQDHQATAACLRVMERQAALLGLDGPTRTSGRYAHASRGGVLIVPSLESETAPFVPRRRLSCKRLG